MATITTLAPIAAQLARAVSLEALFPRGAIDDVLRDHRGRPEKGETELPKEVKPFFGHYCVVVRAAAQLLGAPAFDSLARFHDEVEEEYMPGGPPQSSVYTLGRELENNGDGSYSWVDDAGTSLAHIEVSGGKLRVRVNSRTRLKAAQQRLEAMLGDTIERSLEAHQNVRQAVRAHQGQGGKTRPHSPPLELPPEVAAQFQDAVLAKIRSTLNDPIPQFKGKTLRQLARSVKARPDAISWLREQERILKSNPQLAGLDMRPLWQELALPFQGLETDLLIKGPRSGEASSLESTLPPPSRIGATADET